MTSEILPYIAVTALMVIGFFLLAVSVSEFSFGGAVTGIAVIIISIAFFVFVRGIAEIEQRT